MSDISFPQPSPALEQPAQHGSLPRRVIDTFFAPLALFRRFGARPPWLDVMLIGVVVGAVVYAFIPMDVWVETMREGVRTNPRMRGMDPEAMAATQRIFGIIGAAVVPWIFLAVQAGVMVLLFTVLMGGTATFRQYVSVVAHASLIGALGALVQLPIIIQRQSLQAGITLAALVPGMETDAFLYQFLSWFNVFIVWSLVVAGLGVAALNRRIGAGTAVGVLLGIYAAIAATVSAIF